MLKRLTTFAVGLAMFIGVQAQTPVNRYGTDPTSDIALIYAGSDRHPQWTQDDLRPYVVHTFANGDRDWLFDSFLFLEFTSGTDGVAFLNGGNYGRPATKKDWEWLLDRFFEDNAKLGALDKLITEERKTLGAPPMRHTVIIAMPAPINNQKNWGKVDGRKLDFSKSEDKVTACKWYVDQLVDRFNKAGYENIDLIGTYWIEEALYSNGAIVGEVNDYVRSKGLRAYWIPYYKDNEQFRFNWKEKYRFDAAYQQPNYFFERDITMKQLEDACDESRRYGLGMEMEFETQGVSRAQHSDPDSYYQRLIDYIDVFEAKGVFDQSAIAWYSGTKGMIDMNASTDPYDHGVLDRMARHIITRHNRRAMQEAKVQPPLTFPRVSKVRDLALIYQGGAKRIDWTQDQFEPYVAHKFADGTKDWLFDGYLFLDFSDGMGHNLAPGYCDENANREIWEWYLDRLFERGKSLDALDKCISKNKAQIGDPGFKHRIVLTLPTPITDQKDWGELNGKKLDFSLTADKLAASEWFLDQLIERFASAGYENLELVGIYWVDEDLVSTHDFPKYIAPYIHGKGLEFIWIPYFRAPGHERWQDMGFDMAYHQPNHFFHPELPDNRLDEAVDIALVNGMAMEFECDSKALYGIEGSSYDRMNAYMDAFVRQHVFSTCPIAYYTGSYSFIDMLKNPCPENQKIMDRFARFIVDRRSNPRLKTK
jgi:hypothetical protein